MLSSVDLPVPSGPMNPAMQPARIASVTASSATRVGGRQLDFDLDGHHVEHGEDPAARRRRLADIGEAVLNAPFARRDQRVVGDVDMIVLDVVRSGVERPFGFADAIVGGVECGDGRVECLLAPVGQLVGGEAARDQRVGAVEFLLRERGLGLLLLDIGARVIEALLRSLDLRLGLVLRGGEILGVHAGDDLAGFDHVAFVRRHFRNAPGELGVDVDLVGLDPAVARCDAYRKAALTRMPARGARAACGDDDERDLGGRRRLSV
jgi:hypothetical protein